MPEVESPMRDMRDTSGAAHTGRSAAPAADVEDAIAGLVGVEAVRLVTRADGMVEEVHVAMGPAWRADTLRRDVQALLLHRFDLRIDPDAIHVAQPPQHSAEPARQPAPARGRPALQEVRVVLRPDTTSVDVELRTPEILLHGSAELAGPGSTLDAVAEATLAALADSVGLTLEPVVVDVVDVGQDRVAIATVIASDGRGHQRLTGSALVRGHVEDAMTRAVLDATNSLHRT